jgi:PAS domain S-box-containing protein
LQIQETLLLFLFAAGVGAVLAIAGMTALHVVRERSASHALQGELKDTRDRLHGVIQSAMDAVITVDEDQNVVLFNAAAESIFKCPQAEALGGRLERFIPERFRAAHRGHVERFGVTGTTTRQMGARMVLAGLRSDGEEFPIDASISQVTAGGKKLYTVILRDITERKRTEDALQQAYYEVRNSGERLRGIIQSAMDAIITVDHEQKIVLFNEAAEKIFRCRAEQAIGGPLDRFIPERFRAEHKAHVERFGATRVTTRMMGPRRTLVGLRADGDEFPIDASISQVTIEGRKLYTVILRDVTEHRAAEEALNRSFDELREMSAAMNDVREAERTRIARELHDELAQWLTALKMDISWLSGRLPTDSIPLIQRTEKMRQLVDTTVTAVRRIAADLRPVMLDDLGLVPSIEHVAHAFSERTNVPVSLDISQAGGQLHDPLATAVYRIVQEALTNVARHARASEVAVSMRVEHGVLHVHVRDNGVGLPATPSAGRSHGILGIRERAQTLGGSARIYSPEEGGTVVEISIPLDRYRKGEVAA